VVLPHEALGYIAKESVEHTVAEMLAWFEKWVKDTPPRFPSSATTACRN
jgi:dipeptidyl aminopeptidase/acylaminoacyl peptidase